MSRMSDLALKVQTCDDMVSRQELMKAFAELPHEYKNAEQRARTGGIAACQVIVEQVPSVTPTRPKGKWIMTNDFLINLDGQFIYKFICSECKSLSYFRTSNKKAIGANVCPNCGAEMKEGEA